ncbi:hypothetical protein [Mycobacteroides abscessus]|uniref:hypothetical protein n=1 Tax=Mycobacteroides abscessus TaxID=36809 RepID=UPI001F25FC8C|nr:hypothetical protein [Mycobacteroides abscessus]
MASIRVRARKDGSAAYAVLYRDAGGQQCSQTFDERGAAERFQSLVDSVGAVRALEVAGFEQGASRGRSVPTVAEWARHHLDHLTGVEPYTICKYEAYLRNDIAPVALGALPLNAVSAEDVALWIKAMQEAKASGKTIRTSTVSWRRYSNRRSRSIFRRIRARAPGYRAGIAKRWFF